MQGLSDLLEPYRSYDTVAVRLSLGIVVLVHGVGKLGVGPYDVGSPGAFAGFLTQQGIPLAGIMAWIVMLVEVLGGLGVLLGVLTRYWAVLIAIDMLVATVVVHLPNGYPVGDGGFELSLAMLLLAIALTLRGAGELSLERALTGQEH